MKKHNWKMVVGTGVLALGVGVGTLGGSVVSQEMLSEDRIVQAESYVDMGTVDGVEAKKAWTIHFNTHMDGKSLSEDVVYVLDGEGDKLEVKFGGFDNRYEGTSSLAVFAPKKGYEYGDTYTLYVKDDLKALSGMNIKHSYKKEFTIEERVTSTDIDKALELGEEEFVKWFDEEHIQYTRGVARSGVVFENIVDIVRDYHSRVNNGSLDNTTFDKFLEDSFYNPYRERSITNFVRSYGKIDTIILDSKLSSYYFKNAEDWVSEEEDPYLLSNYDNFEKVPDIEKMDIRDFVLFHPENSGQIVVELSGKSHEHAVIANSDSAWLLEMEEAVKVKEDDVLVDGRVFGEFGHDVSGTVSLREKAKELGLNVQYNKYTDLYWLKNY